ncbi:uncharacterized protein LOC144466596 [Epinephelus lanceolatus]
MMAEFRWIIMSLFLMLLFKFTAAAIEKYSLVGDEVTLSCENVTHDQDNCDSATWLFSDGGNTVTLFEHGKIHREAEAKSDRLSVTANCSLVIKKVTREDVGHYTCRQFRSGRQVSDSQVHLSVVTMTERQDTDRVIFFCSVWIYGHICTHTVKWLYEGNQNDLKTSQSTCSASVTFTTSDYNQKLKYSELLKCEVTDGHTKEVHQFTFSPPQSSGEKPGHDATTAATISSTTTESPSTTGNKWTSMTMSTSEMTNNTASENNQTKQDWWKFIVAVVGLAALIIITVAVIRCKRTKGNKTQMEENMADPEADVSYASISYTKNTGRKAKVRVDDDDGDEGDAVTYSTVKTPSSSSAGASADPRNLYATINKPTKLTEDKNNNWVVLDCSVWTYGQCPHTVKWLYESNQNDLETSQSTCSASVTFTTSDYNQKLKYYELLKCEVTDGYTKEVHQFTFSPPQSSGEKPGHDAATAASTTRRTTTTTDSPSTTGSNWTSMKRSTSEATNNRACENNNNQTTQGPWWFVSVGLAALIISVVTVNIWTRTKGNKTQMDENMEHIEDDEDEGTVNYENVRDTSASV